MNNLYIEAQKLKDNKNGLAYYASKENRWCVNHPTGIWKSEYPNCSKGFSKNEQCQEGV